MDKNIRKTIILSDLFVFLILFYPLWERFPGGLWNLLFYLVIGALFIWMIIKIISEVVRIIKKRRSLSLDIFLPIIILIVSLLIVNFDPLESTDNKLFFGKVLIRACYEGTQNQAVLKLRENGRFDLHQTGVFFYDQYYTGNYKKKSDTLFMDFENGKSRLLSDTMVIKKESIYKIKNDSIDTEVFYLGYCKGLN